MDNCVVDVESLKKSLDLSNSIHFISDLDIIDSLSFAVFTVNNRGPIVQYSDISKLELPQSAGDSETYLHKLAITFISTLGFGTEYIEGILELPSFGIRDHRLILLSTLLKTEQKNFYHEDHMEYFQFAIWFPKDILIGIPPLSIFEDMLVCTIKDEIDCIRDTSPEQLHTLKNSLTQLILATALCKNV